MEYWSIPRHQHSSATRCTLLICLHPKQKAALLLLFIPLPRGWYLDCVHYLCLVTYHSPGAVNNLKDVSDLVPSQPSPFSFQLLMLSVFLTGSDLQSNTFQQPAPTTCWSLPTHTQRFYFLRFLSSLLLLPSGPSLHQSSSSLALCRALEIWVWSVHLLWLCMFCPFLLLILMWKALIECWENWVISLRGNFLFKFKVWGFVCKLLR